MVANQIAGSCAEHAGWLILFQDDLIIIQIYLQLILLRNIQSAAKLNRQNDPSQLIYFSNDSGRFHIIPHSLL